MATISMTEEFKFNLSKNLEMVDNQINEFINHCTLMGEDPYQKKQPDGIYVLMPMLTLRAQIMSSMIEANKTFEIPDTMQFIKVPTKMRQDDAQRLKDFLGLTKENQILAELFRKIIADDKVAAYLHGHNFAIEFRSDHMLIITDEEMKLLEKIKAEE